VLKIRFLEGKIINPDVLIPFQCEKCKELIKSNEVGIQKGLFRKHYYHYHCIY